MQMLIAKNNKKRKILYYTPSLTNIRHFFWHYQYYILEAKHFFGIFRKKCFFFVALYHDFC